MDHKAMAERLRGMLEREYGISTSGQLDSAMRAMRKADLGIFTERWKGDGDAKMA